jgi:rhamnosyltransferase subunit A
MHARTQVVSVGDFSVYVELHGDEPGRETVILVNGALATTVSFRQAARFLSDHYNVVLYDLPYAGQSREHNRHGGLVSKDDEVDILVALMDRYSVNHVISVSWGGIAALLAMSRRPRSLRSGVINSFSPLLNGPMLDYVLRGKEHVDAGRYLDAANLLNQTVGKYLPRLLKIFNQKYLLSLEDAEVAQVRFHADQVLGLDIEAYCGRLAAIELPVLFINGALDEYTSASDVRRIGDHVRLARFATVPDAGHFLELESRATCDQVRRIVMDFLRDHASSMSREPALSGGRGLANVPLRESAMALRVAAGHG